MTSTFGRSDRRQPVGPRAATTTSAARTTWTTRLRRLRRPRLALRRIVGEGLVHAVAGAGRPDREGDRDRDGGVRDGRVREPVAGERGLEIALKVEREADVPRL